MKVMLRCFKMRNIYYYEEGRKRKGRMKGLREWEMREGWLNELTKSWIKWNEGWKFNLRSYIFVKLKLMFMQKLSLTLKAVTKNIQTLNIGHNRLGNDGIRNLQIGLLKNKALLRLGLLNTKITAEGIVWKVMILQIVHARLLKEFCWQHERTTI